ncbi:hypothetical protein POG20_19380, partial [Blautia wexlerae]|nr:hypothetical protein [Blautia wexlerae]
RPSGHQGSETGGTAIYAGGTPRSFTDSATKARSSTSCISSEAASAKTANAPTAGRTTGSDGPFT